jgi:arylformamidase
VLIDITRPMYSGMPVYPGDPAVRLEKLADIALGAQYDLSQLSFCLHSGTHLDAPRHVRADGLTVDRAPLSSFDLLAEVIDTRPAPVILPEHFKRLERVRGKALLFKNLGRPGDTAGFDERVPIAEEAARAIAELGVALVGTEYMDVESVDASGLPVHHILAAANVWILENLDLSGVEPGQYRLMCFPLKLSDAEASPCRAVLQTTET